MDGASANVDVIPGDQIVLCLVRDTPADPTKGWLRALDYAVTRAETGDTVGAINLRIGNTTSVVQYGGHIGYGIDPEWRGRRFAAKACSLLKPVAKAHGMDVLWITCNPDNWASRKTCERLGATLVEIVDLPPENDQYKRGERQKCRYRWTVD